MRALSAISPSLRLPRSPLITFATVMVVVIGSYKAAEAIIADDLMSLGYSALIFAAGAVVVAILNDWRRGLYLLVAWIIFEDMVRKYLGNNMAIYFAKDFLAIILYISFFRAKRTQHFATFRIPFRLPLLLFFWLCCVQIFNPQSTSVFYGLLGMKINFLYVPLMFVGYVFSESEEDLHHFLSFMCVLIILVAGLGVVQSIVGPTFLNPRVLQDDIRELSTLYRTAPISGAIAYRPTSVFVSAARFQDFLIVAWIISLGFSGYLLLRTKRGRTLAFTTVGLVAAAVLMSASRGVFMWTGGITLVAIAGFLWGAPWREREALRVVRAVQRVALLIGAAILILMLVFPEALGSRLAIYSESLMPDSPASELVRRTQTYPLLQLQYTFAHEHWLLGYGLGTCTLGGQYVVRILHAQPMLIAVESGIGNMTLELGILGMIFWILLGLGITFSAWTVVTSLRGTPWFPLAFAIFFYSGILFFPMMFAGNSAYQDFVFNANLWLLLGILYRLKAYPDALNSASAQISPGQA